MGVVVALMDGAFVLCAILAAELGFELWWCVWVSDCGVCAGKGCLVRCGKLRRDEKDVLRLLQQRGRGRWKKVEIQGNVNVGKVGCAELTVKFGGIHTRFVRAPEVFVQRQTLSRF